MTPVDRDRFDQVANIFSHGPSYRAEVFRLGSITGSDNCYWTLLCLQQLARQESAKEAASSSTGWEPKSNFAEQLKKLMCLILRDPLIRSYTETWDEDKAIIPGLFHWKAIQAILGKSLDWKTEYLPSDFGTTLEDLSNHNKFMEFFRAKLWHAQDDF
ncbi:hypothetical protein DFH28DRAFT_903744 [Melampsora americana]|nr:hypothetical protein DFH28DRAFT_903744 [Melampsora americana]